MRTRECWQFKERRGRSTVSREPAAESAREEGVGWRGAEDPVAAVFSSQSGQHGRVWVHSHSQRLGANTHLHTGHPCKCLSICPPCLRSFCPSIHPQASSPLGSRDRS